MNVPHSDHSMVHPRRSGEPCRGHEHGWHDTLGTLSGGGSNVTRIGKRCLLGANAGTGISLGDDSAIEAGLYITRGTLVTLPDGRVVKAIELSGRSGLLFRRHSVRGTVEAVPWKSNSFTGLNADLHS